MTNCLHNYHDIQNEFPAGWRQTKLPTNRHDFVSGLAMLLPFIEQNAVWDMIVIAPNRNPCDQAADSPYIRAIPTFRRPSDGAQYRYDDSSHR